MKNLDEVAVSQSLALSSSNYKSLLGGESLGPNDNKAKVLFCL